MTHKSVSLSPESRCRFRTTAGRRCRSAIHDYRMGLCQKHADLPPTVAPPPANFLQRLTTDCDEFTTAMGIHNSLHELYKLLAADLITARRAAVLAYIANLLLRTIPIVHSELDPASSDEHVRVDVEFPRPSTEPPLLAVNNTERLS